MALRMAGDRNLTAYTYYEAFAMLLASRMKDYGRLLREWLDKLSHEM